MLHGKCSASVVIGAPGPSRYESVTAGASGPGGQPAVGPKVTVMVLNWNRREMLRACLESVFESRWADLAVLVTDCGSTDGSVELVAERFPSVHLLRLPRNLGAPGGRNAAIAWARSHLPGDW